MLRNIFGRDRHVAVGAPVDDLDTAGGADDVPVAVRWAKDSYVVFAVAVVVSRNGGRMFIQVLTFRE